MTPSSQFGRVGIWRGGCRFGLSVSAAFVWRRPHRFVGVPLPVGGVQLRQCGSTYGSSPPESVVISFCRSRQPRDAQRFTNCNASLTLRPLRSGCGSAPRDLVTISKTDFCVLAFAAEAEKHFGLLVTPIAFIVILLYGHRADMIAGPSGQS